MKRIIRVKRVAILKEFKKDYIKIFKIIIFDFCSNCVALSIYSLGCSFSMILHWIFERSKHNIGVQLKLIY